MTGVFSAFDVSGEPPPRFLCGEYTVRFVGAPGGPDWSGQTNHLVLPRYQHSGRWGMRINGTATAEVRVDCCLVPEVANVCPWGHYIVVERTGYSLPVFFGPVINIEEPEDTFDEERGIMIPGDILTITAADPTAWWYEVLLTQDIVNPPFDSDQIFNQLIAMSDSKNITGLTYDVGNTNHPTATAYMRNDGHSIGHYIDSLTAHSIDWTVAGLRLVAGEYAVPTIPTVIPIEAWKQKPSVRRVGQEMSTYVEAFGQHDERGLVTSAAGGTDPKYGRHELAIVDTEIENSEAAERLALSVLEHEKVPPTYVNAQAGGFGDGSDLSFNELLCGRIYELSIGAHIEPGSVAKRLHELDTQWVNGIESAVLPGFEPVGLLGATV